VKTFREIRKGRILALDIYKTDPSKPTLFFIHGLGGRADQWREQIKIFKDKYTLIVPNLLGHGSSKKPLPIFTNPYGFHELNQDMMSLFNEYKYKNNIILGHSYGGVLATSLVNRYPNEINKLVLFNPIPCQPRHKSPIYKLPSFLLEILKPSLNQQFLKSAFDKHTSSKLISMEGEASLQNKMYVIKNMIKGMEIIPSMKLSDVDIPTLIIMGQTDGILSQKAVQGAYRHLPNHHFKMIPDTAHLSMLEKPEKVNRLLRTFLKTGHA
jgi:abhydrolase domain-containing protein 8